MKPVDDDQIIHDVEFLAALISQHAEHYCQTSKVTCIRRDISQKVILNIINGNDNGETVLADLSERHSAHAKIPLDDQRRAHLRQICETGDRIKRMIGGSPSTWSWEAFQYGTWFPGVARNMNLAKEPEFE